MKVTLKWTLKATMKCKWPRNGKTKRFTVASLRCRSHGDLADYIKKIASKNLLHMQHNYFFIPSIKSLICGIAVIYWSVYHWNNCLILKISRAVLKYHQEQKSKEVKAEKEESVRLKKIAASISKEIKQFWSSVEKVIMRKCFAGFFLVISTIWEFSVYLNWKMWFLLLSVLTGMHFFSIVGRQV